MSPYISASEVQEGLLAFSSSYFLLPFSFKASRTSTHYYSYHIHHLRKAAFTAHCKMDPTSVKEDVLSEQHLELAPFSAVAGAGDTTVIGEQLVEHAIPNGDIESRGDGGPQISFIMYTDLLIVKTICLISNG